MAFGERHCYCQADFKEDYMITCESCKRFFHPGCLKSGRPTTLLGDTFFKLTCENCSPTGDEACERLKLQWTQVLLLALYNLQFEGGGKCGYFRWREHVCSFVDRHWTTFFGNKKKTNTWHGTVAGTLSGGCPHFFKSGTGDLGEAGWWALAVSKIPAAEEFEIQSMAKANRRQKQQAISSEPVAAVEGLRQRSHKNAILAAMELKEKRSTLQEAKNIRKSQAKAFLNLPSTNVQSGESIYGSSSCGSLQTETVEVYDVDIASIGKQEDPISNQNEIFLDMDFEIAQELDLDLESDKFSPVFHPGSPPITELLSTLSSEVGNLTEENVVEVTEESYGAGESNSHGSSSRSSSRMESPEEETEVAATQPSPVCRKRKIKQEELREEEVQPKCTLMTLYEEHELLKQLDKLIDATERNLSARRLRRKLLVRQKQRELNLPVFDLDAFVRQESVQQHSSRPPDLQSATSHLDRYMMAGYNLVARRSRVDFLTRLMGLEEEQLECITSPYTLRSLKPFIFRDHETVPLKLKLLQEICAYPHRDDPDWKAPPRHPIDYCYVRPHHIPAANHLCQEFFWPGIDLSECLQYPDFSCVVLYRKIVIAFAFMVPDVSYNEAYISFIFTHPEWRNAGIATFMLYHLIQTCMGKDVTLHVSATNPACFLYQKFGFKIEEYIIDFYNKYLPVTSKDCKNAFFLRLSR